MTFDRRLKNIYRPIWPQLDSFSQPLSWWNRAQKLDWAFHGLSPKNPYYTFYKYKLSVLHVYFGPHSFLIENLNSGFYKSTTFTKYNHIYWWQLIKFNVFNKSDYPWSIWANVYRSQLDVISWKFEWWCHVLFAFIEPVKQLNTGYQLTNVWFSYCWCHCQFSANHGCV